MGYQKHNHLTTSHIPGKQKVIASKESRFSNVKTKGMLFPRYLYQSWDLLSINPNIDLLVIQINKKFSDCVA